MPGAKIEAREDQRRRLPRRPRDGQQRAGEHPAGRRRQGDPQHRAPAAHPEREARLLQRARDQLQHLLAGAGDERQHDDRQRHRPGDAARVTLRDDDQPEDEDRR